MLNTFQKIDNQTIEVEKTETTTKTVQYNCEFLVNQKKVIEEQKTRDNVQRDLEIAEIDELLLECIKMGIGKESII